jgi:hypothetical protein
MRENPIDGPVEAGLDERPQLNLTRQLEPTPGRISRSFFSIFPLKLLVHHRNIEIDARS